MFEIRRYTSEQKEVWNRFVGSSKNGTFLLNRDYMDYHSERFSDFSLMVYRKNKLYALFPANIKDGVCQSHGGLTYGGLIMSEKATAADIVSVFENINSFLREKGIKKVEYKPVPWIYHNQPAEEDLYAIFAKCKAKLVARGLSSAICAAQRNDWYRIRECGRRKAIAEGVTVEETRQLQDFWFILAENLNNKYGKKPVHSLEEMQLLMQRFPENIRLFVAKKGGTTVAGTLLYITKETVHSQYISANAEGKSLHALDLLFGDVIEMSLTNHRYFDFGISTENGGAYLNEALIYQKEGFGGRGVCYDVYEWGI